MLSFIRIGGELFDKVKKNTIQNHDTTSPCGNAHVLPLPLSMLNSWHFRYD